MNSHDLTNNTLRLEILGKLLIESIENDESLELSVQSDYIEALEKQITSLKNL